MKLDLQVTGLKEAIAQLGEANKQVNYAASRALTTTAYAVNDRLKKDMASTFKGGATAYSLRAFAITKAERGRLVAEINLRTDTPDGGNQYAKALAHLFTGGQRKYKKLEGWLRARGLLPVGLAVAPGSAMPLDGFGNMRRTALTEMLGVLGTQNNKLRVYRKSKAKSPQKAVGYFVLLPGAKGNRHPGIYKRVEIGKTSYIDPMVLYINPASYRKLVDLDRLGKDVIDKTFQPAFDAELAKALANAK